MSATLGLFWGPGKTGTLPVRLSLCCPEGRGTKHGVSWGPGQDSFIFVNHPLQPGVQGWAWHTVGAQLSVRQMTVNVSVLRVRVSIFTKRAQAPWPHL